MKELSNKEDKGTIIMKIELLKLKFIQYFILLLFSFLGFFIWVLPFLIEIGKPSNLLIIFFAIENTIITLLFIIIGIYLFKYFEERIVNLNEN